MAKTRTERVKQRNRMKTAVAYLQNYMATYDKQIGYQDYRDETLINDVLYGLGVALDKDHYSFGNGFDKFKDLLRKHLGPRDS